MNKESFFNLHYHDENMYWYYNTFTGSLIKSKYNLEFLKDHSGEKDKNLLIENGFLVNEEIDEIKRVQELLEVSKYSTNSLNVTITPTLGCNFSCFYCFEKKTEQWKSKKNMNKSTQDKIVNYIVSNLAGRNELNIRWFGGEPLLNKEAIENISGVLIKICDLAGIKYYSTIQTNGFLVDDETINFFTANKITDVQITLDGDKDLHNKIRHEFIGQNSFETIINNIRSLLKYFEVTVRINLTNKNSFKINSLLDILSELDNSENLFVYFHPVYKFYNSTPNANAHTALGFNSVEDYAKIEVDILKYMHEKKMNLTWSQFAPRNLPCQALKLDGIMLDIDGDIIKCDHEYGDKKAIMGNVETGITDLEKLIEWTAINPKDNKYCSSCQLLPTCLGNCASIRKYVTPENACPSKKYNYMEQFKLKIQTIKNNSIIFDTGNIKLFSKSLRTMPVT